MQWKAKGKVTKRIMKLNMLLSILVMFTFFQVIKSCNLCQQPSASVVSLIFLFLFSPTNTTKWWPFLWFIHIRTLLQLLKNQIKQNLTLCLGVTSKFTYIYIYIYTSNITTKYWTNYFIDPIVSNNLTLYKTKKMC